jgi:serine/threonine-protein kinase
MGMVYLAHDTVLERDVALKVMAAQIADDQVVQERFAREAKAVAKMTHPNVVMVFDLGYHVDGSPFIAMELLKGQDLQKAIRSQTPLSLERKISIILQVLAGLAHAHQAGIVHRDVKPANIFINQDGSVKIMDFGVARLTSASMTGTGNIVGTADYMSPEQVKGARVDGRSDLFSVGCLLYELVTGRRPFHADNLMAIFYKITHTEADFDVLPEGEEYKALAPILRKAMSKNLDERYQTAYEMAVDLRDFLRRHATSSSGARAFEALLEMDQGVAPPLEDGVGPTLIPGDEAFGVPITPGTSPIVGGTLAAGAEPTVLTPRAAGPTVLVPRAGTPAPRPAVAAAQPAVRPAPAAVSSKAPLLYGGIGAAVLVLAVGGYFVVSRRPPAPPPEASPAASVPTTVAEVAPAPPSIVSMQPVTPTLASPSATVIETNPAVRRADAALRSGDYARAREESQKILRKDPQSAEARQLLEQATKGLEADQHLRLAEASLGKGDLARASAEIEAARAAAPWEPRIADLSSRVQQAQQRGQQQAQQQARAQITAQANAFLNQAETALAEQKYDAAIALYEETLKIDPQNSRALQGKSGAIAARAIAQAAAGRGGIGKSFVVAKTTAQSAETRAAGSGPEGFEVTPDVQVQKGSQASELPGKILFDVDPGQVKAGSPYKVRVYLLNEGRAPIQVREMIVGAKVNGRGVQAPVPPLTRDVAPQQKALLREIPDFWKEDTTSWSMEVVVRTARGETYKNQVTWK